MGGANLQITEFQFLSKKIELQFFANLSSLHANLVLAHFRNFDRITWARTSTAGLAQKLYKVRTCCAIISELSTVNQRQARVSYV